MPRVLVCSTPRVGSVSYSEKLSHLLQLPLAFQPWEPYAFNKQPQAVKDLTLKAVDSDNVLIHSHINSCLDKLSTVDHVIYIGRKNRIQQVWSFIVAYHLKKMQNLKLDNIIVPEPEPHVVGKLIEYINLWDKTSEKKHRVFYEDLNLDNSKWFKCEYNNVSITNFEKIEKQIRENCNFQL